MRFFRDTSISNKVLIPPIIMVAALVVVLILGSYGLDQQQSVLNRVNELSLHRTTMVNQFISLSERAQSDLFRISVLKYMKLPDAEIRPIHENLEQVLIDLNVTYGQILTKWPLDPEEKRLLEEMRAPLNVFQRKTRQATAAVLKNPSFGILMVSSASVPFEDFKKLLSQFLDYQQRKISLAAGATRAEVGKLKTTIVVIALFTVLLAILISIWIGKRFISRPVRSMTEAMGELADGNLETAIDYFSRKDEIGSMVRAVEVFRQNAIEKKETEKALRESEANYRTIFDTANDAFFVHDLNTGQILDINQKTCDMYGYTVEEAGRIDVGSISEGVSPYSQKEAIGLIQKAAEGTPQIFEWRARHKNGTSFWVEVNLKRITIGDKDRLLAIVRDISERKRSEIERAALEDKLHRAQKMESLGLMAGGIAHDLNNILSGIVTYPELLLMDLAEESPMFKPLKTIQESGRRAADVVADLMTIARGVAAGKQPLNLNTMVAGFLGSPEFRKLEKTHPLVNFNTELDSDLLNMRGSPTHISKILMNLISNACEAIASGGQVTLSTRNRYLDEPLKGYEDVRSGEYVVLKVSDEGSGISDEDLERIFEPFYTKKVMGRSGTGLGLAVVWNTVQDHNGYINVKSRETGTLFEIYFPVTREAVAAVGEAVPLEDYQGHGEKILIVDDEERQREIAGGVLTKLGYEIQTVASGEEAILYVKEYAVDLILLDMVMPKGMNGRETYEEIIKIQPGRKAVIASGYAKTKDVEKIQKLGAGQYIKKPYTLAGVGLAVKAALKN